jgi:hypothetical protein
MPAKAPARPLSNLRGQASRWDACFWVMSSSGVASLNRPAKGFDASDIGTVILSLTTNSHSPRGFWVAILRAIEKRAIRPLSFLCHTHKAIF